MTTYFDKPLDAEVSSLNSKIITESVSYDATTSFNAGESKVINVGGAKLGYNTIGAVSITGRGISGVCINEFYVDSNELKVLLCNTTSSAKTITKLTATILYMR